MYKNYSRDYVLNGIFEDYLKGELETERIFGIFLIGIYHNDKITLFHDSLNYLQAYYLKDSFCISSSMLALAKAYNGRLNLDKYAVVSNIVSGCSFGNNTLFEEIKKLDNNLEYFIPEISYRVLDNDTLENITFNNRTEAIKYQEEKIDCYFFKIKNFLKQGDLVDTGLSGGYDSRLVVAKLHQHDFIYQVHTNYKDPPDKDVIISRRIAKSLKKELKEVKIGKTKSLKSSVHEILPRAMYFYDGQIRVNHGWSREYRTSEYRRRILGDCILGLSGHNGEQYRNYYHFIFGKISQKYFIKQYVFNGLLKRIIPDKEFRKQLTKINKEYFRRKLELDGNLSHTDLRHYYSYEWVWAGPGIRASIENQLSYFLMPFTDASIIKSAEKITPYIGCNSKFQSELIKRSCSKLRKIPLIYGYNLEKKSNYNKLLYSFRCLIPLSVINYYRHTIKPKKKAIYTHDDKEILYRTDIPIDWNYVFRRGDEHLIDRSIALAYLLNHLNNKIRF